MRGEGSMRLALIAALAVAVAGCAKGDQAAPAEAEVAADSAAAPAAESAPPPPPDGSLGQGAPAPDYSEGAAEPVPMNAPPAEAAAEDPGRGVPICPGDPRCRKK